VQFEKVLTRNFGVPSSRSIETYRARGGYEALRKALEMGPDAVLEEVKRSKLRGRGGAGFPTGLKWSFLPKDRDVTYLCVNADESEPGTFKDRCLIENDPHQLLEGLLITALVIRATRAYIYIRAEYHRQFHILQRALEEAYSAGLFGERILGSDFSLDCCIHRGAGAYICGEETALLESIEGRRPWPRIKPPYPAVEGLFGRPTIINNVETLCCVVHIIDRGAEWFASMGTPDSAGPKLYTISGPVRRPGCYEGPLGLTVRELVFGERFAGGLVDGKRVKAVVPGGLSVGFLTADELDCRMTFEDPARYGLLGMGTGGIIVIPDDVDMLGVLVNVTRFFASESCGQCTQCREGTAWMHRIALRLAAGRGRAADLDLILEIADSMGMMTGKSICGLADGARYAVSTLITKFREDLDKAISARSADSAVAVGSRTT